MSRCLQLIPITLLAMPVLVVGCEEIEATPEDLVAAPDTSADSESSASSGTVSEGRSTYGRAYRKAEGLEDKVGAYQEELMKTADGVFDDTSSRQRDD